MYNFPNYNMQDLNLDWILQQIKNMASAIEEQTTNLENSLATQEQNNQEALNLSQYQSQVVASLLEYFPDDSYDIVWEDGRIVSITFLRDLGDDVDNYCDAWLTENASAITTALTNAQNAVTAAENAAEIAESAVDVFENMVADEYDSTKTYNPGDYAIVEVPDPPDGVTHILYRCIAQTTGSFEIDDWVQVAIANDVTNLKRAVYFTSENLSDVNGKVYIEPFEIGSASVSDSALVYGNLTNKIRTKQNIFNYLKSGDTIKMTTSGTYKYLAFYSADRETWETDSYHFDTYVKTIENTGYYCILIGKQDNSTISPSEVEGIASKLKVERNSTITELTNRISEDESDIEENSYKIEVHAQRLFNLDGIIELPTMELGQVECIAGTGFVYTNSTKRIRTPEGITIPVKSGDIISSSDWATTRFFGGYKKSDNSYVQIVTQSADYEMQEDGELVLSFRYEPSADISDIHALQSMFTIYRPKEDEEFVEAKETLKHNDIYYTGREIRRVYNPYHNGGNLLLSGQLHCHTRYKENGVIKYYNDGSDAIAFGNYHTAGYDFMTVTNYGHMGEIHHPDVGSIPEGLIWLFDSQEAAINGTLGTPLPPKHSCVYNGIIPYDWQNPMSWQDWADITKPKGEMVTIAHPFWDATYQPPTVLEKIKGHIRFCEVYNGEIINNGYTVETPTGKGTDYAWETMLDKGLVTWGTAVNDAHTCTNMTRIKDGCVKVFSDSKDRMNIIKNLCNGNFIACSNI